MLLSLLVTLPVALAGVIVRDTTTSENATTATTTKETSTKATSTKVKTTSTTSAVTTIANSTTTITSGTVTASGTVSSSSSDSSLSRLAPLLQLSYSDTLALGTNNFSLPNNNSYWVFGGYNTIELGAPIDLTTAYVAISGPVGGVAKFLVGGTFFQAATTNEFSFGGSPTGVGTGPNFQAWLANTTCLIKTNNPVQECIWAASELFAFKAQGTPAYSAANASTNATATPSANVASAATGQTSSGVVLALLFGLIAVAMAA